MAKFVFSTTQKRLIRLARRILRLPVYRERELKLRSFQESKHRYPPHPAQHRTPRMLRMTRSKGKRNCDLAFICANSSFCETPSTEFSYSVFPQPMRYVKTIVGRFS